MIDIKKILIENAKTSLFGKDIKTFSEIIINLYKFHVTCDCFFKNIDKEFWHSLFTKIESEEEAENFYFYFAKAFLYLRTSNDDKAFIYLSKALDLEPLSDICYLLKSGLNNAINPNRLNDAKEAVVLSPSFINYFALAQIDNQDISKSIFYYQKAINLNNNSSCAYAKLANVFYRNKDYYKAIEYYFRCIEIEPKHLCYFNLCICLRMTSQLAKAKEIAILGFKYHPTEFKFLIEAGICSEQLENYNEAINYYNQYLEREPNDKSIKQKIKFCSLIILENSINKAKIEGILEEQFIRNTDEMISTFEELIDNDFYVLDSDLELYLKYLLIHNKPGIKLNEKNPNYLYFTSLNESYNEKTYCSEYDKVTGEEIDLQNLRIYKANDFFVSNINLYERIQKKISEEEFYSITEREREFADDFSLEKFWIKQQSLENDYNLNHFIKYNPEYFLTLIIQLNNCCVEMSLFTNKKLRKLENYFFALEINMIKIKYKKDLEQKIKEIRNDLEYGDYEKDDNYDHYSSREDWLADEFGEDASTAYWNID